MSNVTVKSYRPQREKEILDRLDKSMERVGAIVERQAKINTVHPMPSGKQHPKRSDTSRLASSIIHWLERDGNSISAVIGSNVIYGKYLEFGTVNHPPYPWLFPAVELKKPQIIELLKGKIIESGLEFR